MLSKIAQVPEGALDLERIFTSLDLENDIARQLFQGKYLVFLQRNLLPWKIRQPNTGRSIGDSFETCLVIHAAKPKRRLAGGSTGSFIDGSLSVKSSGSFSEPCDDSIDDSVFETSPEGPRKKFDYKKYNVYLMPQNESRDLLKICTWLSDQHRLRYPVVVFAENGPNMSLIKGFHRSEAGKKLRFSVINPGTVLELENVPRFDPEMKLHCAGFPLNTPVTVEAFAQFKIPFVKSKTPPCKSMDVNLECFWDGVKKTFEPPSSNGTFFVNLRCVEGDNETGAFERFKELKIVTALCESLESGEMTWSPSPQGPLSARLEALIADEKTSLLRRKKVPRDETTYGAFGNAVLSQRKDLDFVEKLWLILKDSSSSEELVDGFTYVYGKLKEFPMAPYVHAKSTALFANEIKTIGQKSIQVPSLDAGAAIALLLEIGVEKIKRDYVTLLNSFDFVSVEYLQHFCLSDLKSPKAVLLLKMLHVIVELSFICFEALRFPQAQLVELVRSSLQYFKSVEAVDLKHSFQCRVPAKVACAILNAELLPSIWEVSLSSSHEHYKKQTVVRLTQFPRPKRFWKKSSLSKTFKEAAYVFYRSTIVEDEI